MARCVCDIGVGGGGGGGGCGRKKSTNSHYKCSNWENVLKPFLWEEEDLLEVETFRAFRNPEYMKLTNGSYSSRVFLIS